MGNPKPRPESALKERGTPFNKMGSGRKTLFICKLIVCILTFGLAFPNVMAD